MTDPATAAAGRRGPAWLWVATFALAYLPFTLLGYGTDIDVANVLRAGRSWLDGGDYQLSRAPGAPVHELATAVLDRIGGSVLVNLASVAFAGLALWALHRLVLADGAEEGGRRATWAGALLASSPWFWIAATSLGDFVWALGLGLAGAVAAQRQKRVLAGVLFGLAIGSRASSAVLLIAWLLAERTGQPARRATWRATSVTAAVALAVGAVCFLPPWFDAGGSLAFFENEHRFAGLGVHLGRWAVKNLALIGVLAAAVLLAGVRHLLGGLARWPGSPVVRFAVTTIVASELLYLRFPFKVLHLLPVVAGLALLLASSPKVPSRWLALLVAAQLVGGVVGTTLAAPDVEDDARSGRLELGLTAGPLLTDVRCRLEDRDRGPWPPADSRAATRRAEANARCQNATWRAE